MRFARKQAVINLPPQSVQFGFAIKHKGLLAHDQVTFLMHGRQKTLIMPSSKDFGCGEASNKRINLSMPRQPAVEDQAIAARIVALRKSRGLSQSALAHALGVTFQQVQKYERGTNRITANRLAKLAVLFKVPISAFFDDPDEPKPFATGLSSLLGVEGAEELAQAYAEIENPETRRVVLNLIRILAGL